MKSIQHLLAVLVGVLGTSTNCSLAAQPPTPVWVQRYDGPANGEDVTYNHCIALNRNGDVVVTGYSIGLGSSYDYSTIQYSGQGLPLWTNRYNGPGNGDDHPYSVAIDWSNNVIVTGYSYNGGGNSDYATIMYSNSGLPLWTNRFNGSANSTDTAWAVGVDGDNNIVVTGGATWTGVSYDFTTIKYSNNGLPLWTNRYNGPGNDLDIAYALAVDGSNSVVVAGTSVGSGTSLDYAVVKYTSSGIPQWTNRYNWPGAGWDIALGLVVDGSNNVIVTGYSAKTGGDYDYATISYSSAGSPLWTNRYNGPGNTNDNAYAIAVDANNDVIVTGKSAGIGSLADYVTIKYSSTGVPFWTNRYNGPGNGDDYAYGIAVDRSNNIIVTGKSTGISTGFDYATLWYSALGVPLCTNRYNGPVSTDDIAYAIAVNSSLDVFVTGGSFGSSGSSDFATIKYSSNPQPIPLSIQRANNGVVLGWTNASFALQSAPTSTGTFTNLPGATSPHTNPITGAQQFFRLISN